MRKYLIEITCLSFCVLLNIPLVRGQKYTSVINIESGPVRGLLAKTIENKDYAAFKGIPYAKPPVGKYRFKAPVPADTWTEVYNATRESNICSQYNEVDFSVVGSEDCLYINVFTPHTEFHGSISKPVMVWFYGGAFKSGNSNASYYGPDFILGENVIMVSFNYRVGALGFLNLNHEGAPGNSGLKDQSLALKWVKKNIAYFGGNPDKITIFGQSAGAVSVDLQVLSDMSAGLFSQSISMSGSTLSLYWAFQSSHDAVKQAFELGKKLGIGNLHIDVFLELLIDVAVEEIIIAAAKILGLPFRPSLETYNSATNQERFLSECSLKKYLYGNYTKGPHMLGFTANETVSFGASADDLMELTGWTLNSLNSGASFIPFLSDLTNAITTGISNLAQGVVYKVIQETTDLFFVLGIDTKQRLISRNNDHPIYYYRFSFDPHESLHRTQGIELEGAGHMDEVPYLLYMPSAKLPLNQPEIVATRRRMVKLWTNFAKYGNPTPNGNDDNILGIIWPDSRSNGEHLEINYDLSIGSRPTDSSIRKLQKAGLGTSPILNDCTRGDIVGVLRNIYYIVQSIF